MMTPYMQQIMMLGSGKSLAAQVAAILRKYGTDAHVYLPGIGTINGLTAGNYLDSAGTTAATVDNPVGLVLDAAGDSAGRRNLLTYSEQFDNAVWNKSNITVSANATTAPNGTLTADKVVASVTSTSHFIAQIPITGNADAYAIYLKAAEESVVAIGNSTTSASAVFNLATGTITSKTSGCDASITSAGNGWYRCYFKGRAGTDTGWTYVSLRGNFTSYLGDGVSGIYVWGVMENTGTLADYQQIVAGTGEWATGIHALQATTAHKPILRKGAVNLLTYSEQFDNARWVKTGATISADASNSPTGTLTADKLVESATTAIHEVALPQTAVVAGNTYTISFYVKKSERRYVGARFGYADFGIGGRAAAFDLDTMTYIKTADVISADIQAANDGFYRCSLTMLCASTGVGINKCYISLKNSFAAANADSYLGDGTSGDFLWGAMLNTGTIADYIPTTTAPASNLVGSYHWVHDSTDLLTATYPAGYESAAIVNALSGGQSTLTAQNIVGAYSIGPSVDTYGRFIFKAGCTASELAIVQQYANRLAGV